MSTSAASSSRGIPTLFALLLAGFSLLAAGCSGAVDKAGGAPVSAPVVLTMLAPVGRLEAQPFLDAVDSLSGGALRIEAQGDGHRGELGAEADLVHEVQSGRAALVLVPVRAWNALGVRAFDALIAPFAVDSLALEQRVLDSDLVDTMLAGTNQMGLTGIGILPGPIRHPVGVTAPFLGPEDYKGRTLAISDSVVAARTFRALGATTEPSAFSGQPIDGVDGAELQVGAVQGNRYDAVAHWMTTNVNVWPRPLVVVGNPEALAALGDHQRQVLRDAARAALLLTLAIDREAEELEVLCRAGHIAFPTATPEQVQALRRGVRPVLAWLRKDAATRRALDRIDSMREEVIAAGAPEQPAGCAGITTGEPSGSATAATQQAPPLDGVYTMSTTVDDLAAAGTPGGDRVLENYGEWVFVVDGDRFAFTQANGPACTWGYGSWQVADQTVHWLMTDGGGAAPNGAANKPGEAFAFGWSLYQDTLTLAPVPGAISPPNFFAQPWHRISRTPQPGLLSPRCPPPPAALPAR